MEKDRDTCKALCIVFVDLKVDDRVVLSSFNGYVVDLRRVSQLVNLMGTLHEVSSSSHGITRYMVLASEVVYMRFTR